MKSAKGSDLALMVSKANWLERSIKERSDPLHAAADPLQRAVALTECDNGKLRNPGLAVEVNSLHSIRSLQSIQEQGCD